MHSDMTACSKYILGLTLLLVLCLAPESMDAQCAMCKAVLESEVSIEGAERSKGINSGILYLMGFPYLLIFGFIAYIFKDKLRGMVADMV